MARLRWMAMAVAVMALAALLVTLRTGATGARAASPGGLAVQAPSATQTAGTPFDVTVAITRADQNWAGYNSNVIYDPSVLKVDAVTRVPIASCDDASWGNPYKAPSVLTACVFQDSNATGPVDTIRFECLKDGRSALHLITTTEDTVQGSTLIDDVGANIGTDLTDAEVTCGAGGALATVPIPTRPSQSDFQTETAGAPWTPVPGSTESAIATMVIGTRIASGTVEVSGTPASGTQGGSTTPGAASAPPSPSAEDLTPGSPGQKTYVARYGTQVPSGTATALALGRTDNSSGGGGSNTGLIIGIIAAVAVVAALGAGGVFYFRRRQGGVA